MHWKHYGALKVSSHKYICRGPGYHSELDHWILISNSSRVVTNRSTRGKPRAKRIPVQKRVWDQAGETVPAPWLSCFTRTESLMTSSGIDWKIRPFTNAAIVRTNNTAQTKHIMTAKMVWTILSPGTWNIFSSSRSVTIQPTKISLSEPNRQIDEESFTIRECQRPTS